MPKQIKNFEEFHKLNDNSYGLNSLKTKKFIQIYKKNYQDNTEINSSLIVENYYHCYLVCVRVCCLYLLEKYQNYYDSKLTCNELIEILEFNFVQIEKLEKTNQLYLFNEFLVESIETLKKYFNKILNEISKTKQEKVIKEIDSLKMQKNLNSLISEFEFFHEEIKKYSELLNDPEFKEFLKI